jgi:hypothetical protein
MDGQSSKKIKREMVEGKPYNDERPSQHAKDPRQLSVTSDASETVQNLSK